LTELAYAPSSAPVALLERARHPIDRPAPVPLRRPTVSVIIPALNEARNLPHVLGRLPEGIDEVILVDGRSTDDTVAVARRLRPDVRVVEQTRKGKGNALACGFDAATGDIIVMIDADGSTDPAEIPRFVDALVAGATSPRVPASSPAAAATTSPPSAGWATGSSTRSSTSPTGPATPTSATATTPSGATASTRSGWTPAT
jgi:GT2 family glycosyltransferase